MKLAQEAITKADDYKKKLIEAGLMQPVLTPEEQIAALTQQVAALSQQVSKLVSTNTVPLAKTQK